MKGHEQIIAMRTEGLRPAIVFINDYPCKTNWYEFGENATVCTHGDSLSSLDLRFLKDLRVSISSTALNRVKSIFEKSKVAGAATVAACLVDPFKPVWEQSGWCEVWHG